MWATMAALQYLLFLLVLAPLSEVIKKTPCESGLAEEEVALD